MAVVVCRYIVGVFGVVIAALSLWGIFVPNKLTSMVQGVMAKPSGLYVAVAVRLVLGAALIVAAPQSKFPTTFLVLGWIAIAAAVGLPLVGRARISALLGWFVRMPSVMIRLWLLFGLAFGAFLVYGAG